MELINTGNLNQRKHSEVWREKWTMKEGVCQPATVVRHASMFYKTPVNNLADYADHCLTTALFQLKWIKITFNFQGIFTKNLWKTSIKCPSALHQTLLSRLLQVVFLDVQLFLEKSNRYFGESAAVMLLCRPRRVQTSSLMIVVTWIQTQKYKEKEPQQQIWAEKEKDLFDESIVDAW